MAVLSDGQFEIDGVPFGGVWDSIKVDKVEPPEASWDTNDTDNAFRASTFMGADLLRPVPVHAGGSGGPAAGAAAATRAVPGHRPAPDRG